MSTQTAGAQTAAGKSYATAAAILLIVTAWIVIVLARSTTGAEPEALIKPMLGMFSVTWLVWFVMLIARNLAFVRGTASEQYFLDFRTTPPDERIERPARTFNNLMQVPVLFYVICILMLVTKHVDAGQLILAWTFVALRALHALVYILINFLPYRFAIWVSGWITLCVIWVRFAAQL
jgi:hypothetical protein